jgi:Tfp pilus assembly protein PilN
MLQDIKNIFNLTQKVYAIDVEINTDGAYHCNAVELVKQKGAIDFTVLEMNDETFGKIQKKTPVCLILNGKGIIHRKITVNASLPDADIIKQIIPNVNPEDFYIQKQEIARQKEQQTQIISLARKSLIDKVIADMSESFDFIVDVSINPFALDDILPVISNESLLHYKNISIHIRENKIEDFTVQAESEEQTLEIGNQSVNTILLPALGIGFSFLINPTGNHASIEAIQEKNKEYLYKQKTQLIGKISLISVFIILIINFLIFDHFYKKTQEEQPQVIKQEELINKVKQLNETLSAKSKFLQQSGLLTPNKISFYADRIASTIPDGIMLTDWQFNPPADPNKKETFTFKNGIIVISGISNQSAGFNNWIKELKNSEGIESVSILGYDHDIKANAALFTIELTFQ